jgi:hypothetical protein
MHPARLTDRQSLRAYLDARHYQIKRAQWRQISGQNFNEKINLQIRKWPKKESSPPHLHAIALYK